MHVSTIAAILAFTAGMVTNAAPIASLDQLGTANAPLNANSKPEATPKGRGRQPTAGEVLSGVADASIIVANSKREARRRPGSTGAGGLGPKPTTSDPPGTNSKREARRRPGSTGAGGLGPKPTTSDPPGTNSKREARRRPGSTGAGGLGPKPTTSDPPRYQLQAGGPPPSWFYWCWRSWT
ncbi:hypothetical protein M3J07_005438 [Ascochyta lentis]